MNSIIIGASYIGKALSISFGCWSIVIICLLVLNKHGYLFKKRYYVPEAIFLSYLIFLLITTGLIGNPWHLYGIRNISFSILPSNLDEMKQCVLNIALFIPLGFYLSLRLLKKAKWLGIILIGAMISVFIEITQVIFIGRIGELGDVIYNSAGTAVGFMLYMLLSRMYEKSPKEIGTGTLSIDISLIAILSGLPLKHIVVADVWLASVSLLQPGIFHGIHYGEIVAVFLSLIAFWIGWRHKNDYGAKCGIYASSVIGVSALWYFIQSL